MSSAHVRKEVLSTYRKILRLSLTWRAAVPSDTQEERAFIIDEARTLFRRNKDITDEEEIKQRLQEAKARLEMALHYNNPYPRPVNLPPNFVKTSSHKKAQSRRTKQSKPVYVRSLDDDVQ